MRNIVLMGPQGSGKGTQAKLIAKEFGIPHISTGDLFREAAEKKSELGLTAEKFMKEGKLVPDEVTVGLVKERLAMPDCAEGYILDGFPRDLEQANALDEFSEVTHVIELAIPDDVAVERISSRFHCPKDGSAYGLDKVPKTQGKCDLCGTDLVRREDDMPESVKKRLAIYHDRTAPLMEFYRPRGITHRVDGIGSVQEVFERARSVLL